MNKNIKSDDDTRIDFTVNGLHYENGRIISIDIKNGVIQKISETGRTQDADSPLIIAPGLIDNQINGYAGIDFSHEDFSSERMRSAVKEIWKDGVTTFLPTLITNSHKNLIRNFRILSETLRDPVLLGSVPGFHLEGPYLSSEAGFFGCHPVQHLRKPSWEEFTEYQEAADGKIIQVTISPELEGAMEFIRLCNNAGVVVSIGHTNATAEQINNAVENGARLSTHLGNGCANLIDRHLNPLWPQLANDRLTPSIIADGHHLLPEEIQVFLKVKGKDNIILTSDVTHLIGMAPGNYVYMGSNVVYTEDGLVKNPELNCLAGASLPLRKGIETMLNWTGCSLADAINMATYNVARIYGLENRGSLAPGKRADIILFQKEQNRIIIKKTFVNGHLVYPGPKTRDSAPDKL
jgi:N-acetylglucosamine-6-phosphate deacetylase